MKNILAFIVGVFFIMILSYVPPQESAGQLPAIDKTDTLVARKAITSNYVSVLEYRKLNDSAEMSFDSSATKTQKQMSAMYSLTKSLFNYMKKKESVKVVYIDAATGAIVDPKKYKPKQDIDYRIDFKHPEITEPPIATPPVINVEPKKPSWLKRKLNGILSIFK